MSYFKDFIEPYIGSIDEYIDASHLDRYRVETNKGDLTWTNAKGVCLKIAEMDFSHVHHVINMLQRNHMTVPTALYERLSKEKEEIAKGFDIEI